MIPNTSKRYGGLGTKLEAKNRKNEFARLKSKVFLRGFGIVVLSFVVISIIYTLLWRGHGGEWLVSIFQSLFKMDYENALNLYQQLIRNNMGIVWGGSILLVFLILYYAMLTWFIRYFNQINQGIDALLKNEAGEITLPAEMSAVEKKLNSVRQTLDRRAVEARLAEQRKNDLVMYLAHDIRTPLTSVIGYLSLLDEAPDMLTEQRAKYVHITLEKAHRLEKLVNEFFEITRYNLQQINLEKEQIDLYYMLVQMEDEFYPILSERGNTAVLCADENLTVYGDPAKLARVFNNILKNAAAYNTPNTEILIRAEQRENSVVVTIQNQGPTIPADKLSAIFEKFYRMDEARTSDTGGAGLGLAIAKEIVTLHGGTITVESHENTTTFTVALPILH